MSLVLTERAHAKINLDLAVLNRRADGFHEVHTVLQALELHDTIRIESIRGPFRLDGDSSLMPLDRTNLVWRAAEAMWSASGRAGALGGVRVRVDKHTPSQAGLGGGSSDAAATLVGLNRLWRLRLSLSELVEIAARLGADVPFFLVGGTALGLGRGERLFPLPDVPLRYVVLAQPPDGVGTADAYRWLAEARAEGRVAPRTPAAWLALPAGGRNDFEPVVEARHPEVASAREALSGFGAETARMSGSGSAVFGLFRQLPAARRAAAALSKGGFRTRLTRTRRRSPAEIRRLRLS